MRVIINKHEFCSYLLPKKDVMMLVVGLSTTFGKLIGDVPFNVEQSVCLTGTTQSIVISNGMNL